MTTTKTVTAGAGVLFRWLVRYLLWIALATATTLGGAAALMILNDWSLKTLLTAMLAWPVLGLAAMAGALIALLPFGRVWLWTAIGGGLAYNLLLLVS
jgi:hypothetical protein